METVTGHEKPRCRGHHLGRNPWAEPELCRPSGEAKDEGRKRVIGIMAAILTSMHMERAGDLFGGPQGSPRTDKLIAASIQWAELIMRKIDNVFEK
jgi:hypothetical protein